MKPNKDNVNHFRIISHNHNQTTPPRGSKENEQEAQLIINDILEKIKDFDDEQKQDYIKNIGVN